MNNIAGHRFIAVSVVFGVTFFLASWQYSSSRGDFRFPVPSISWYSFGEPSFSRVTDVLHGDPTPKFRNNLKDDLLYITAWTVDGFTNAFMTYMNLIYLAILSQRVPIIPPFPSYSLLGDGANILLFGTIFDIPRLEASLRMHILEWDQVKNTSTAKANYEDIGCWTTRPSTKVKNLWSPLMRHVSLNISFTDIPDKFRVPNARDIYRPLWQLALLGWPDAREDALLNVTARDPPPDEKLLCFDWLFYTVVARQGEWDHDFAPVWRFVGTYARWTPWLEQKARRMLANTFGTHEGDLPPYIAIHARHSDFEDLCMRLGVPKWDCFPSMEDWERRVNEMKEELRVKRGLTVTKVVMTSDEVEPSWWEQVRKKGWVYVNHTETAAMGGLDPKWHATIFDAVIQSMGAGLVGTERSSMSLMAGKRVVDWNNGFYHLVKWGKKGADAHHKRVWLSDSAEWR